LHDIGKIGVPDTILAKPGPLNDEEWRVMRLHPRWRTKCSSRSLSPGRTGNSLLPPRALGWLGYPRGLKGEDIPPAARMFAVIDVWDALTHDRPYRPAWPEDRVRAHLRSGSGKHFDPRASKSSSRVNPTDGPLERRGPAPHPIHALDSLSLARVRSPAPHGRRRSAY